MIYPTINVQSINKFKECLSLIEPYFKNAHIDLSDGFFTFTKNPIDFEDLIIKSKIDFFELHLMVKDPYFYIEKYKNIEKIKKIYFHYESTNNKTDNLLRTYINLRNRLGIAIKPNTPINKLEPYLKNINDILLLSVNPGPSGSKFIPITYKRIDNIHKLKPKINILVDGGINDKNILKLKEMGIKKFAIGSYLYNRGFLNGKRYLDKILKNEK